MLKHSTPHAGGVLEALDRLIDTADNTNPFVVYRHGRRFEMSGPSVAVYDATLPWPDGPYTSRVAAVAARRLIDRYDIEAATLDAFHAFIDEYDLALYLGGVA